MILFHFLLAYHSFAKLPHNCSISLLIYVSNHLCKYFLLLQSRSFAVLIFIVIKKARYKQRA
nr:MAG TPA: hypothetical protein [Caudoviricetes sp.]